MYVAGSTTRRLGGVSVSVPGDRQVLVLNMVLVSTIVGSRDGEVAGFFSMSLLGSES